MLLGIGGCWRWVQWSSGPDYTEWTDETPGILSRLGSEAVLDRFPKLSPSIT